MAWHHISPEVTLKGFTKCCIFSTMDGTDDMLWNDSKRTGTLAVSVRKMKTLTVNMEAVK
jgi:hypothetical protein